MISDIDRLVLRRAVRRVIPILFVCYILAYLDRINVGFAKLQMQRDLGMTDAVYGTGAGAFFVGYFLFEVPANVALQKVGARKWLSLIMAMWGLLSAATMFVKSPAAFYLLRFLLGVVEAGFFPGVLLYLTFWFPHEYRARVVAWFMAAIPLSGVIGGPISGWILARMSTFQGLRGWQWLFLIEGLPSVAAAAVSYCVLDDSPKTARWLTQNERATLTSLLAVESGPSTSFHHLRTLRDAFSSPAVWLLCVVFFGFAMGSYGIGFWLPQILKDSGTNDLWHVGLLSAIPWMVGAICMVSAGVYCDRTGRHRFVIIGAGLAAAVAFAISSIPWLPLSVAVLALSIATGGVMITISMFWSLPTQLLASTAAAAGIAWINSIGNLAGYVCPYLVGRMRDESHSMTAALLLLATCLCLAALLVIFFKPRAGETSGQRREDESDNRAGATRTHQFGAIHD